MQHRLIFDDTPLEKVAQQFNLYSKRRLVIADRSPQSAGVTGGYSASDPAALIGFLRSQQTLHVVETADEILVTICKQRQPPIFQPKPVYIDERPLHRVAVTKSLEKAGGG